MDIPPEIKEPENEQGGCGWIQVAILGAKIPARETLAVVFLALLADFCLWTAPGGAGFAALIAGTVICLPIARQRWVTGSILYGGACLAIAVMALWNFWWLQATLAFVFIGFYACKLEARNWRITEAIAALPACLALAPFRLLAHVISAARLAPISRGVALANVLRIAIIPVVVTCVFAWIFSAANPVVGTIFDSATGWIGDVFELFLEGFQPARPVHWLFWAAVMAALVRPLAKLQLIDQLASWSQNLRPVAEEKAEAGDGFAVSRATFISVNILFLLYNILDGHHLYLDGSLPEGISWTQYTHSGCAWLTGALLLSAVVIGIAFQGALNFHPRARLLRKLAFLWAAQNVILAASALVRIVMYVDFSGLTHLRVTGIYGVALVISGLGLMVWKLAQRRSFLWLVRMDLRAFLVALTLLAITPLDVVCTQFNVSRVLAVTDSDPEDAERRRRALRPLCLKNLSPAAIPHLARLLDYAPAGDPQAEIVRHGIAAIISQDLAQLPKSAPAWTRWQLSSSLAAAHSLAERPELKKHRGQADIDRLCQFAGE